MYSQQFQSLQGPADDRLRHSELEGYQPVSRIGEVVINSFGALPTRTRCRRCARSPPLTRHVCAPSRRL